MASNALAARPNAKALDATQDCRLSGKGARWLCDRSPPLGPGDARSVPTTLPANGLNQCYYVVSDLTGLDAQSMVFFSNAVWVLLYSGN